MINKFLGSVLWRPKTLSYDNSLENMVRENKVLLTKKINFEMLRYNLNKESVGFIS